MIIQLNGNPHETRDGISIPELLESLGLRGKPVVVELDERAVFPRDYPRTTLTDGARIEVVTLAAGG